VNDEPNNTKQNEMKRAVGLRYNESDGDNVPTVIAKGFGELADEILNLAEQHDVMIHQDKGLVDLLSRLDLGQEIPDELYHVIAELIAFSYVLQGKFPDSWKNSENKIDFKE
jgi:flagellar biosynthesis protein